MLFLGTTHPDNKNKNWGQRKTYKTSESPDQTNGILNSKL